MFVKKTTVLTTAVFLSCLYATGTLAASNYTGEAIGRNGPVKVQVTLDNGKISEIKVLEQKESIGISEPAIKMIPEEILNSQSLNVDNVSGATKTSKAILAAVESALQSSGTDLSKWKDKKEVKKTVGKDENTSVDIVVLGGGAAGMAAMVSALENGAKTYS